MFVLRECFRSIRRTPGTFVMSVLALGIAVGLGAFLASTAVQAHARLSDARAALKLQAFFDPAVTSEQATTIAQAQVRSLPAVAHVEVISKEQALQDFAKSTGENVESNLGMNPLPASVTVYLKEPTAMRAAQLKTDLEKVSGIVKVKADFELLRTLESRTDLLQTLAAIFGGLCLLATLFFLVLAGRYTIALRAETEHILQSLGATRRQARSPLTLESIFIGLLGGALATGILVGLQRVVLARAGAQIVAATTTEDIGLLIAASITAAILVSLTANRIARVTS
jgi:cell division transport system permease protein